MGKTMLKGNNSVTDTYSYRMASLGSGEAYLWANKQTDKAIIKDYKNKHTSRVTKHGE
jgi:hypothetical protein